MFRTVDDYVLPYFSRTVCIIKSVVLYVMLKKYNGNNMNTHLQWYLFYIERP